MTREEFEELREAVRQLVEAQKISSGQVADLHRALVEPQPGHSRSLLDRMAEVTIAIESGDRTMRTLLRLAQFVAAAGAVVGTFWAAVRFGASPK